MARILIPDYQGQHIIAGIKSLSLDGNQCDVAWSSSPLSNIFKSKYVEKFYNIISPDVNEEEYVSSVIEILKNNAYDMVIPFGNKACHAITMNQNEIKKYSKLLVPSIESHQIAFNKIATYKHCLKHKIKTPKTFFQIDEKELNKIVEDIVFPCVIKPSGISGNHINPLYAKNFDDLIQNYKFIFNLDVVNKKNRKEFPIIQEYIPGFIHDACVLAINGTIINILTQTRKMMYPITGGVGAVNFTTKNQQVIDLTENLIKTINWTGPAQVEYKYDENRREYYLIEINPKFWGTLDLSIRSGINFPLMVRDILLGKEIVEREYEENNIYYFLFPQATCAKLQLIFSPNKKMKEKLVEKNRIFFDIDFSDPLPLIKRIIKTLKIIITGKWLKSMKNELR